MPKNNIENRRAHFDYALNDKILAGLVLSGAKVRALRDGRAHLKGAYVAIRHNELWLQNASFHLKGSGPSDAPIIDTSPVKLLVKKRQLATLQRAKQDGYSIIPTKIITGSRFIKLEIALGRGKKLYDKRETLKRRDSAREADRLIKGAR
ncbi:SsrA-binding protein SmpB [Candidatus Saccharibacteria bacterium]|nr:SsrA-binding protein SmpB [Candidatus Saccharibacteria bacterium]